MERVTCDMCMKRRWTVQDDWVEPVLFLCGCCFLKLVTVRKYDVLGTS